MGLLDRFKRKPAEPARSSTPQPAAAPAAVPASKPSRDAAAAAPAEVTSTSLPSMNTDSMSLVTLADTESLRDMLIAAHSARDQKLFANMATANRSAIMKNFTLWQRVPEEVRNNEAVMQRYAHAMLALGEHFRTQFGDTTLMDYLTAPALSPGAFQSQWEQGLAQAEALSRELHFDEAQALLGQILNSLAGVPKDVPVPFHAVTHGRLGHALFAVGKTEEAANHMWEALQLSQQRDDNAGIAASLRGLYEIHRYMGKFPEAAGFADRLSARVAVMGDTREADFWTKQATLVRTGEPLCRVVFFINDQQSEIEDVPRLTEARLRFAFVRNRPPLILSEGIVEQGMQLGSKAQFAEALERFQQAMKVDPFDPSPHYQAALTLMHLERPQEAVAAYDEAERLAPGWFNVRGERWVAAEVAAGRIEPAIYFIIRTEDISENSASWEQKLNLTEQAIGRAGELPILLLYRSRCLIRLGRAPEAEPIIRAALANATEPDLRTRLLVDLQMLTTDGDEKQALLNEAIALNGNLAAAAVAKVTLRQMEAARGVIV